MNFLIKMILKKPNIIGVKSSTVYAISGGFVNVEWKVKNELFCILRIGSKIKFFRTKKSAAILVYNSQKIDLIAFGFFGISSKSSVIKMTSLAKKIIKKRTLDTSVINIENSKLNSPKKSTFKLNKSLGFSTKNINFNINQNILKHTK